MDQLINFLRTVYVFMAKPLMNGMTTILFLHGGRLLNQ